MSLRPAEALVYAKKEMENAQAGIDDPDLYAPLFRNISVFKRYVSSTCTMSCLLTVY